MLTPSAYSFTADQWKDFLVIEGASPHVLKPWLDGLYKNKMAWEKHISPKLINSFNKKINYVLPTISTTQEADDGTVKFLIRFEDNLEVETVLIPFHKKYTICLSTQVGCGMKCSFCYTGTQGLKRNLTSAEIVLQYLLVKNWLQAKIKNAPTPNIVFMGQGEPLHNLKEVKQAILILNDPRTLGLGKRQITLSTVGYLPGLKNLLDFPHVNIALSLHSPFEEERNKLIPVNEKYPLSEVLSELDKIPFLKDQYITFEYLLIGNLNMSDEHIEGLFQLLGKRKAILNLIPFNPFPGSTWIRPNSFEIEEFKKKLVAKKLRVLLRKTKGSDILAACGQLKVNKLARNHAAV